MNFYEYNASRFIPASLTNRILNIHGDTLNKIEGLSKINILVGQNNSGKSFIMRELFKNPTEPIFFTSEILKNINKLIGAKVDEFFELIETVVPKRIFIEHPNYIFNFPSVNSQEFYIKNIDEWQPIESFIDIIKITKEANLLKIILDNPASNNLYFKDFSNQGVIHEHSVPEQIFERIQFWLEEIIQITDDLFNKFKYDANKFNQIYIHFQRSIWKSINNQSEFRKSISDAYQFPGEMRIVASNLTDNSNFDNWVIETGMELYDTFEKMSNRIEARKKLFAFERFLSDNFFDRKEIPIVPGKQVPVSSEAPSTGKSGNTSQQTVHEFEIQIGNEVPQPIHNLGTGIQMIIMLTWFMFEFEYGIVFIEEPELFIHPGLQKQLMRIYDKHEKSDNFQFFIATHSNHIIDYFNYSNDVSIFSIKKNISESVHDNVSKFNLNFHDKLELELLDDLGVSNSSVFLSNCTIWVEGNTDWKYLRKLFEIYQSALGTEEQFKENLHFAFLEYGGSLLAHWMFGNDFVENEDEKFWKQLRAKNISTKIFVIADKDENKEGKHEKLKIELKGNYLVLPCREIENILPLNVINKVVNEIEGMVFDFKESKRKGNNFREMKLGEFIKKQISRDPYYINYNYLGNTKGNRSKQSFCNKAISCLDFDLKYFVNKKNSSIEEVKKIIGNEAFNVCKEIHNFINKCNLTNK